MLAEAVHHTLCRLRRAFPRDPLARAEMEKEAVEKVEGKGLPAR